jgi:hypothetical protein
MEEHSMSEVVPTTKQQTIRNFSHISSQDVFWTHKSHKDLSMALAQRSRSLSVAPISVTVYNLRTT